MASGKRAVYAAIIGNFMIAVMKFIGAAISGSAAMLAEAIHSLVDTGNGGLLLLGMNRSRRPPTRQHPFGYGKEVYFYTLVVAILIFGIGGGISIYEGILHVQHPSEMGDPTLSYIVLGLAILFEGFVWIVAFKEFQKVKTKDTIWKEIRSSKDPITFTVLFEDTAALLGLSVALLGLYFSRALNMPVLDGSASIVIGVILCGVASLLIIESKGLLLGESVDPAVRESVHEITARDPDVLGVARMMSMHLGPHDVLVNLEIRFRPGLILSELETSARRIEQAVREQHPDIKHVSIEIAGETAGQDDGVTR